MTSPGVIFMNKYVVVADDSEAIADILSVYLKREGFQPIAAADGQETLDKIREYNPLLVLLDIMMPVKNGLEVLKEIRSESKIPVIMITARSQDADIIMGLDYGADDYIVKPFSPAAVMARIRAVLRRLDLPEGVQERVLRIPGLEINMNSFEVRIRDSLVSLTRKETEILWLLASNPSQVFTRDHLLDRLWGYDYDGDNRAVDTHIKRLRSKLGIHGDLPWEIKTVWGVGYKFEVTNE